MLYLFLDSNFLSPWETHNAPLATTAYRQPPPQTQSQKIRRRMKWRRASEAQELQP